MDADIRPMWPTPIWIGQVDAAAVRQVAEHVDPESEVDLAAHAGGVAAIAHLERAVTDAFGLSAEHHRWRHRLAVWPTGFYRGMAYTPAVARALVIVASNPPGEHPESGVLSLHDPRTGAANVALPGLPWGRPTRIPPITGGAVAIPGWVGCSIAPLRANHTMSVWTAEATALQP